MQTRNLIAGGSIALAVAFTSGCGGDSSSSPFRSGVFLDSAVIGIEYMTETQSGFTNAFGRYRYLPGETVTFKIGNITFPPVTAQGTVTPLDIAGTTDINDDTVVNIIRLLQTLDSDDNPDNGITIPDGVTSSTTLDFTVDQATFATAVSNGGLGTLIPAQDAIDHFQTTLDSLDSGNDSGLPDSIAGNVFDMIYTSAQEGSPYANDEEITFTFSSSGAMFVDIDPIAEDGDEIQVDTFTTTETEYIWEDTNGGYRYSLSLNGEVINEINVNAINGGAFLGQFVLNEQQSGGLPIDLQGTYSVTGTTTGTHTRGDIIIDASGNIDFDTGKTFNLADGTLYDRTNLEPPAKRISIEAFGAVYGLTDASIWLVLDASDNLTSVVLWDEVNVTKSVEVTVTKAQILELN